jgi:hypothetical protein
MIILNYIAHSSVNVIIYSISFTVWRKPLRRTLLHENRVTYQQAADREAIVCHTFSHIDKAAIIIKLRYKVPYGTSVFKDKIEGEGKFKCR